MTANFTNRHITLANLYKIRNSAIYKSFAWYNRTRLTSYVCLLCALNIWCIGMIDNAHSHDKHTIGVCCKWNLMLTYICVAGYLHGVVYLIVDIAKIINHVFWVVSCGWKNGLMKEKYVWITYVWGVLKSHNNWKLGKNELDSQIQTQYLSFSECIWYIFDREAQTYTRQYGYTRYLVIILHICM